MRDIHLKLVQILAIIKKERWENMPIVYKVDIIKALKEAGYSTYRIRKEKILGEATLQKIRNGDPVSWENISVICRLLNCQPGDILEYVPDEE